MPKTIQSLHVSHHFDDMRAQWITLFQLAIHQGPPDFKPFGPSLNLKHALKTLDHIESPNVFELLLQLGLHRSQHEAANLSRLILEFLIAFLAAAVALSAGSSGSGSYRTFSFLSCLRTILRFLYQVVKFVPFSLSFSRMNFNAKLVTGAGGAIDLQHKMQNTKTCIHEEQFILNALIKLLPLSSTSL